MGLHAVKMNQSIRRNSEQRIIILRISSFIEEWNQKQKTKPSIKTTKENEQSQNMYYLCPGIVLTIAYKFHTLNISMIIRQITNKMHAIMKIPSTLIYKSILYKGQLLIFEVKGCSKSNPYNI